MLLTYLKFVTFYNAVLGLILLFYMKKQKSYHKGIVTAYL